MNFFFGFFTSIFNPVFKASVSFYGAIIIVLFAVFSGCSDPVKSPKELEREIILINKIRMVTEFATNSQLGSDSKEYVNHIKWYNEKGLNTKETVFFPDGRMDFSATHTYNEYDKLVLTLALKPDSSFFYKKTFTYDKHNNLIEKAYFEHPDATFYYKNVAVYDSLDRMTEYYWWWPSGLRAKNLYVYEGMVMTENIEYDMNGIFTSRWLYTYDNKGNLTESVQYYPDSLLNSRILQEYNKDGRVLKQTEYFRGILRKMSVFQYNEKNMLLDKTEYSAPDKISSFFRYQYEYYK